MRAQTPSRGCHRLTITQGISVCGLCTSQEPSMRSISHLAVRALSNLDTRHVLHQWPLNKQLKSAPLSIQGEEGASYHCGPGVERVVCSVYRLQLTFAAGCRIYFGYNWTLLRWSRQARSSSRRKHNSGSQTIRPHRLGPPALNRHFPIWPWCKQRYRKPSYQPVTDSWNSWNSWNRCVLQGQNNKSIPCLRFPDRSVSRPSFSPHLGLNPMKYVQGQYVRKEIYILLFRPKWHPHPYSCNIIPLPYCFTHPIELWI